MQRLKSLSLVVLFIALTVSLAVSLGVHFSDRIEAFERTQASRSRMQAQIHDTLHGRYAARIVETRLLGRCSITAYIVTLRDADGSESTLYFDIDSGAPIRHDLLNGCPRRLSGPVAVRDSELMPVYEGYGSGVVPVAPLPPYQACRRDDLYMRLCSA